MTAPTGICESKSVTLPCVSSSLLVSASVVEAVESMLTLLVSDNGLAYLIVSFSKMVSVEDRQQTIDSCARAHFEENVEHAQNFALHLHHNAIFIRQEESSRALRVLLVELLASGFICPSI